MRKKLDTLPEEFMGITDANYLYMKLVNKLSQDITENHEFIIYEDKDDGRTVALNSSGIPSILSYHGYQHEFKDMTTEEALQEIYANGFQKNITFNNNAFMRIIGRNGNPEPVIFRDLVDALAFLEKSKRPE